MDGGEFFICRIYGVDTPETPYPRFGRQGQPYGKVATLELKRLIQGQVVKIEATAEKTYNREVCIIKENDTNYKLGNGQKRRGMGL
jgi:endonuclease YncB( thermonuclease family)